MHQGHRERHHHPDPRDLFHVRPPPARLPATANLAGNQTTATNSGDLTGTRVEHDITTSFRAGYSVTTTAPNAGTFTSSGLRHRHHPFRGGVGGAGCQGGAHRGYDQYRHDVTGSPLSGGPVRDVPASGSSPAATFATVIGDTADTPTATTMGMWAQTPDPSAQIDHPDLSGQHGHYLRPVAPPGL